MTDEVEDDGFITLFPNNVSFYFNLPNGFGFIKAGKEIVSWAHLEDPEGWVIKHPENTDAKD